MKSTLLSLAVGITAVQAAETIVGVYVLSRHGDRTDKSHPPTKLTTLGYDQMISSGQYYRDRYISTNASSKIMGIASAQVMQSQVYISATDDNVLMNSAQAFLQGLYPPVGDVASETLRNGTEINAVNDGYQLIPVHTLDNGGTAKEDATWLQGTSGCNAAIMSGKAYSKSEQYQDLLASTADFYQSLESVWAGTFTSAQSNFSNAYAIYDVVNVALIHNKTIPSSELLTKEAFAQLQTLADQQQYNLAYNMSEPARAIQGSTFAAEVLSHLNSTITTAGKAKVGIQFNAYATFQAFFGLAQLPAANSNFYGIPDYASSMAFELFTTADATVFPDTKDLSVRFLYHNGSTVNGGELVAYPLFGQEETVLSWDAFVDGMNMFAVTTQEQWCTVCANSTGTCAAYNVDGGSSTPSTTASSGKKGGMSLAVAGVIGALVTLAVVLIAEALVMALVGLTIVKKKNHKNNLEKTGSQSS